MKLGAATRQAVHRARDWLEHRQETVTETNLATGEVTQVNYETGIRQARRALRSDRARGIPSATKFSALSIPAFMRSALVISGAIGELPAKVVDDDGMPIPEAPRFGLLDDPDPDFPRFEVYEAWAFDVCVEGNAIGWVVSRDPDTGAPLTTWQVPYSRVSVEDWPNIGRPKAYRFFGQTVSPGEVLHFRGVRRAWSSEGMNPIEAYLRRAVSHSLALDNSSIDAATVGLGSGAFLKIEDTVTASMRDQIKQDWADAFSEATNAPPILGKGADLVPIRRDPNALQLIEARQFSAIEVAVMMGVKPGLIGLPTPESNAYTSALMDATHFVRFTLGPWLARFGQVLARQLPDEYQVKFDSTKLLTPDFVERMQAYATGIKSGMLDPDEARGWEGLPPMPDPPPGMDAGGPVDGPDEPMDDDMEMG